MEAERLRRTRNLLVVRVLLSGAALVAFALYDSTRGVETPWSVTVVVYAILGGGVVLTVPYALWLRFVGPPGNAILAGVVSIDFLLVTGLVLVTGGTLSLFLPLYFGPVLAASFLFTPRWGVVSASAAVIAICAATVLQYRAAAGEWKVEWLWAPEGLAGRGLAFHGANMLLQGAALHTVGILGGRLASGLHGARRLTEVIVEGLAEGVITTGPDGRVTYLNDAAVRLLDLPSTGGIGRVPEDLLRERGDLATLLLSDTEGFFEREVPAARTSRPVGISVSSLHDRRGGVIGRVMVVADLAPVREIERLRARGERVASEVRVAAGIAHEIRNPLGSIRWALQALEGEATDRTKAIDLIGRECERINGIVEGMLDFARPVHLRPVPLDLRRLLGEVADALVRQTPGTAGRIGVRVDIDRPVQVDLDILRRVLLNLGENALQAIGPEGKVTLSATLSPPPVTRSGTGWVRIEVADDGRGIDTEGLQRLFEPFYTTRPGGTGLGMPIVWRLVEGMGGEIDVDSRPGGGTCVTVWIPAPAGAPRWGKESS